MSLIHRASKFLVLLITLLGSSAALATLQIDVTNCDANGNCTVTWTGGSGPGAITVFGPAGTNCGPPFALFGCSGLNASGTQTLTGSSSPPVPNTQINVSDGGSGMLINVNAPCTTGASCYANTVFASGGITYNNALVGGGGGGSGGGGGHSTPLLDGSSWNN